MNVLNDSYPLRDSYQAVNNAFSKQSFSFDEEDFQNPILQEMRKQVYEHVDKYITPDSNILELNAGTGIDALRFIQKGHRITATDLSDGMVEQLKKKKELFRLENKLQCIQLSYENLNQLTGEKFDFVFSNMGGLNCLSDLTNVTRDLPVILKPKARVTLVIMPPVYLWELMGLLKGNIKTAFRRLHKEGVVAHLEGEYFKTYYHSLSTIKHAFGSSFKLLATEGLCSLTPPPHQRDFPKKHPGTYKFLRRCDESVRHKFPFNRWADHIIVTFEYNGE